jgi:spore maturation protein CgeB
MRFVYFTQSLRSCWNNGNAHFVRGVLRELLARGHDVRSFEPEHGWSRMNLLRDAGTDRFGQFHPDLLPVAHFIMPDLDAMLDGADVVLVHEWNDPHLVTAIGRRRARGGRFILLFHDTHHRAVTDPDALRQMDLSAFDGVLAFGAALADVYGRNGWEDRCFVWHEAADTRLFHPPQTATPRQGVVWIGNWGDEERSEELRSFLLSPARDLGLPLDVHGVRYPEDALAALARAGARYRGWLPNAQVPKVFARHTMTVHVPRRTYASQLPGIPTIRVFEALACGIPLICAPWQDSENLFRPGIDYLQASTPAEMRTHMAAVASDHDLRASLIRHGLETITARHTCAHRVDDLLAIVARLGAAA